MSNIVPLDDVPAHLRPVPDEDLPPAARAFNAKLAADAAARARRHGRTEPPPYKVYIDPKTGVETKVNPSLTDPAPADIKSSAPPGSERKYSPWLSPVVGALDAVGNSIPFSGGMAESAAALETALLHPIDLLTGEGGADFVRRRNAKQDTYSGHARENPGPDAAGKVVGYGVGLARAPGSAAYNLAAPAIKAALPKVAAAVGKVPGMGRAGAFVDDVFGGPLSKQTGVLPRFAREEARAGISGATVAQNEGQDPIMGAGTAMVAAAAPNAFLSGINANLAPELNRVTNAGSGEAILGPQAPTIGYSPRSWVAALNPDSLRNEAARKRFSSLRSGSGKAEGLADSFGGIEEAGDALNSATIPTYLPGAPQPANGPWSRLLDSLGVGGTRKVPLLGPNSDAETTNLVLEAIRPEVGGVVGAIEATTPNMSLAPWAANGVKLGRAAKPNSMLPQDPGPAFTRQVLGTVEAHGPPRVQYQGVNFKGVQSPIVGPNGQPLTTTRAVPAGPVKSIRNNYSVPTPVYQDVQNATRRAAKSAFTPGASPLDNSYAGLAKDQLSFGKRELENHMRQSLSDGDFAKYMELKRLYHLTSRGDEAVNGYRTATGAPASMSSVIYGAAGAELGGKLAGLPGLIVGRKGGELIGRQSNVNPSGAFKGVRLAEGMTGQGIDPEWVLKGAAANAAIRSPAALTQGVAAKSSENPQASPTDEEAGVKKDDPFYTAALKQAAEYFRRLNSSFAK